MVWRWYGVTVELIHYACWTTLSCQLLDLCSRRIIKKVWPLGMAYDMPFKPPATIE
ncbi:MAG TPA: hypothetical protein VFK46_05770 [Candidatus Macondimonas sp.]|nr:hypothetical protein [Candidatus Macondimonas sp.]